MDSWTRTELLRPIRLVLIWSSPQFSAGLISTFHRAPPLCTSSVNLSYDRLLTVVSASIRRNSLQGYSSSWQRDNLVGVMWHVHSDNVHSPLPSSSPHSCLILVIVGTGCYSSELLLYRKGFPMSLSTFLHFNFFHFRRGWRQLPVKAKVSPVKINDPGYVWYESHILEESNSGAG